LLKFVSNDCPQEKKPGGIIDPQEEKDDFEQRSIEPDIHGGIAAIAHEEELC
jgi:hypothetical protein